MGLDWKRGLRAIGTGGMSEVNRAAGNPIGQLDPGPNGNDMPAPGYERRSADQVQWDPITGMPINTAGPPAHEVALQYQYRSQELIRRRQQALWGDAQNVMGQAGNLLQSYRPGGSAALGSGVFSARAGLYANQASSLTEPDLMSAYREDQQIRAEREARRARNLQMGMSLLGMGASVAAAAAGAPVAPGAGQMPAVPGSQPATPGAVPAAPSAPAVPGAAAPAVMQPYGPPVPSGGVQQPPLYGIQMPPVVGPNPPPGFETASATMGGGGAAPSGGGKGGGAPGGAPAGGGGGAGPGGGMGGGAIAGGGYGQDGAFTGMSAGASAMRANPIVERVVLQEIVSDPVYQGSTQMRMKAARRRLLEAMA